MCYKVRGQYGNRFQYRTQGTYSNSVFVFSYHKSQCPSRLAGKVRRQCDAENLKLSSDSDDSSNKKLKQGYSGAYGWIWCSLRMAEVWILESRSRICIGSFGRNVTSVTVKMFLHLISFTEILNFLLSLHLQR